MIKVVLGFIIAVLISIVLYFFSNLIPTSSNLIYHTLRRLSFIIVNVILYFMIRKKSPDISKGILIGVITSLVISIIPLLFGFLPSH